MCWSLTGNWCSKRQTAYLTLSETQIQKRGWLRANQNMETSDCQVEKCQTWLVRRLSLAQIFFTKISFARVLWTEHLSLHDKALTGAWASTQRKFLKCFPDSLRHSVRIWLGRRERRWPEGFILVFMSFEGSWSAETQLAHLKQTCLPNAWNPSRQGTDTICKTWNIMNCTRWDSTLTAMAPRWGFYWSGL